MCAAALVAYISILHDLFDLLHDIELLHDTQ